MEKDVLTQKKSIGLPITLICIGFCLSVLLLISNIQRIVSYYVYGYNVRPVYLVFACLSAVVAAFFFVTQIIMFVHFLAKRNDISLTQISFAASMFFSLLALFPFSTFWYIGIIYLVLSLALYILVLVFKRHDSRTIRLFIVILSILFAAVVIVIGFLLLIDAMVYFIHHGYYYVYDFIYLFIYILQIVYFALLAVFVSKRFLARGKPVEEKLLEKKRQNNSFDDLRELKKLHDEGVLTEEEFSQAKEKILKEKL